MHFKNPFRAVSGLLAEIKLKVLENPWPYMAGVAVVAFIAGYELCSQGVA
jgi:hypothetical protein